MISMSTMEAVAILDKYDFNEFINGCLYFDYIDAYEIMDSMRYWFKESEIDAALDNLSIYEVMDYISVKYNVIFDERIRYYMRRTIYPTKKPMRSNLYGVKE